jgi:hypothetical protein
MNVAFDTLNASKRLRDAGVEERAADAIVELVQSATHFPDISGLATKSDIRDLATKVDTATKADIADLATKADTATKAELADLAHSTKMDIQALKADLTITKNQILAELNDKLRFQGLALMGGMTAIVGLATAIIKLGG